MVIIHQNNQEESKLLKMGVRICPSFWYQMALFRVVAHGLIRQFVVKNKLMSVCNASVLLLTMNFVITLSKSSADPLGYRLVDPQLL